MTKRTGRVFKSISRNARGFASNGDACPPHLPSKKAPDAHPSVRSVWLANSLHLSPHLSRPQLGSQGHSLLRGTPRPWPSNTLVQGRASLPFGVSLFWMRPAQSPLLGWLGLCQAAGPPRAPLLQSARPLPLSALGRGHCTTAFAPLVSAPAFWAAARHRTCLRFVLGRSSNNLGECRCLPKRPPLICIRRHLPRPVLHGHPLQLRTSADSLCVLGTVPRGEVGSTPRDVRIRVRSRALSNESP